MEGLLLELLLMIYLTVFDVPCPFPRCRACAAHVPSVTSVALHHSHHIRKGALLPQVGVSSSHLARILQSWWCTPQLRSIDVSVIESSLFWTSWLLSHTTISSMFLMLLIPSSATGPVFSVKILSDYSELDAIWVLGPFLESSFFNFYLSSMNTPSIFVTSSWSNSLDALKTPSQNVFQVVGTTTIIIFFMLLLTWRVIRYPTGLLSRDNKCTDSWNQVPMIPYWFPIFGHLFSLWVSQQSQAFISNNP